MSTKHQTSKAQPDTRERLLHSAMDAFAASGFRDTTVAEICTAAKANIAAVNYHFGDKESLYNEVWRHAFALTNEAFPLTGDTAAGAPPAKRLRAFVLAILRRVLDDGCAGRFPRLMIRELAEPTAALAAIVREVVMPQRQVLLGIVRELLGDGASEDEIQLCAYSIVSQCHMLAVAAPVRLELIQQRQDQERSIDAIADHVTRFALGGLAAVREHAGRAED